MAMRTARVALIVRRRMSVSDLGGNHRYDSQRAGIHDEDLIADQDIFIVAILWGILHDSKQAIYSDEPFSE
jgi:hypothetical protein